MAKVDSEFSKRLIGLRNERKVSQVAFGDAIGIPRSTISGYETEGKEPDYDTLNKIADFFGVSCDYLLGRSDERKPCDIVFRNDAGNFKKIYDSLPKELRDIVSETFDSFYVMLHADAKAQNADRLLLYRNLLVSLCSGRSELRQTVDAVSTGLVPASALSKVVSKENEMKTSVSGILDALLDSDMSNLS